MLELIYQQLLIIAEKVAALFVAIGLLSGGLGAAVEPETTPSLTIDNQQIKFVYTDDNTDEDLFIYTTKSDYFNLFGSITVDYAILNNSGQNQNVKTVFFLNDGTGTKKYVSSIGEYNGEEIVYSEKIIPAQTYIATSTGQEVTIPESTEIIEEQVTKWKETPLVESVISALSNRKDTKGMTESKSNSVLIKDGETKFFKAKIQYTNFTDREEFFIEAFGDQGGYGHLDPWIYEQKFNTLNTAALNGQDSWSGDPDFDVQESEKYEGAKAVSSDVNAVDISRAITGTSSGTVYIAHRKTANNVYPSTTIALFEGVGIRVGIYFNGDGKIYVVDNTVFTDTGYAFSANTWYLIRIDFDAATNQFTIYIHNGVEWSSAYGPYTVIDGSMTEIDGIKFLQNSANVTAYWDTITPNDPTVVVAVAEEEIIGDKTWW